MPAHNIVELLLVLHLVGENNTKLYGCFTADLESHPDNQVNLH